MSNFLIYIIYGLSRIVIITTILGMLGACSWGGVWLGAFIITTFWLTLLGSIPPWFDSTLRCKNPIKLQNTSWRYTRRAFPRAQQSAGRTFPECLLTNEGSHNFVHLAEDV